MYANAEKAAQWAATRGNAEGEEIYAEGTAKPVAGGSEICMILTYFFEYTKTKKL